MTPLPPVRKRKDYSDISPNDLTYALFHDRIAPHDAMRPETEAMIEILGAKEFTVYKSSDGSDRWLAITTSAYEDKDREIISTKAIAGVVSFGDKTKERGPLRYWHVPGLDIGDCDFQAQGGPGGRFLIEGGTFRSKAFADLGRNLAAQGYQMSPGFIHTDNEPVNGVYDNILIYERSAVPLNRSANLFTRFATKEESTVITPEKIAEYREKAAGNDQALQLLDNLLATAQEKDDTAQARNVVYKDAPEWAQALIARLDGLESTVKAFGPASAEQAGETEIADAEAEQADDGEEPEMEAEEADDGGMDDAAFAQLIARAVVEALTPLLDIEKKMSANLADLKSTIGSYTQQKDDAAAQTAAQATANAQQIALLDAKLKELTGDLPSSVLNGAANYYRASQAPATRLTTQAEAVMKEQMQQAPAGLTDPAEIAAYQLIFPQG